MLANKARKKKRHFTVAEGDMFPGSVVPLHAHRDMDEMFYVLDGEVEFMFDGDSVRGRTGTFVHVPAGVRHGFRSDGAARLVDFHTPGGFEHFFEECGTVCTDPAKPPPAQEPDMKMLAALFDKHGMDLPPRG